MLPQEFRQSFDKLPTVFLPLGTVEWHGEHDALGLDALKAHALCVRAANQSGGIVHPPLYGGMGGLDKPSTIKMEAEHSWENYLLRPWLEKMTSECHRLGFEAIIMITGHYGHNQQIVVREVAIRMSERLQIPVLGIPEYWLALDAGYLGDHAGIGETSLLWHLEPDLVAIDRIRNDPDYGKNDRIEKGSSPELGRTYAELIIDRLACLAIAMPKWAAEKRAKFVTAERSILSAQIQGWRLQHPWAAWQNIHLEAVKQYGQLLVEEKFDQIVELSKQLRANTTSNG
jgi:creatinine amidohydrolase